MLIMKIFLDSANLQEIQYWNDLCVLKGVTTNIKLLAEQNITNHKDFFIKICNLLNHPVCYELQEDDYNVVYNKAIEVSNWHRMMVVKVPMWPSGMGVRLLRDLRDLNIRTNATWITSITQSVIALQTGVNYISYFYGRVNKNNINAYQEIQSIKRMIKDNYFPVKSLIVAASIHNELEFRDALKSGADIITVPSKVLGEVFNNPLTLGIQHEREEYYINP